MKQPLVFCTFFLHFFFLCISNCSVHGDVARHSTQCLVVDNGSWSIKCGVGGRLGSHRGPQVVAPSVSSRHLSPVIERGLIADWTEMERIWKELLTVDMAHGGGYDVAEHAVLMMLRYGTPKEDRAKMMEILFESVGVAAVHLAPAAALSIYGTGSFVSFWFLFF